MDISLKGKSALVTGSVRGLGLEAVRRFAAAGCNVVIHGFGDGVDIEAVRSELERAHGIRALSSSADLREPRQIEAMIASALDAFGAVDILVNNAVVRHEAPVESFGVAAWEEGLAVNLSAAFHTIRLSVPGMRRRGWGRIINMSSIYGFRGAPNRVNYVTCKTGLLGLTRAVALETIRDGITCNAVCPGTVDTPVHRAAIRRRMEAEGLSQDDAERRLLAGKQPTGRLLDAGRVASLLLYLCSPEAADITGAALPIDAGWSIT